MATRVTFRKVEEGAWRASLLGANHIGGTGETPAEALGWLCLNHPQPTGIEEFVWQDRPPKLPHPEVSQYPEGVQEPFVNKTDES